MEANDMKAMREALEAVAELFWEMHSIGRSPISNKAYAVKRKVKAALAAPPRNCDIGSVKEQSSRHMAFCNHYPKEVGGCHKCPCIGEAIDECTLIWAQMPYDGDKTKGTKK